MQEIIYVKLFLRFITLTPSDEISSMYISISKLKHLIFRGKDI